MSSVIEQDIRSDSPAVEALMHSSAANDDHLPGAGSVLPTTQDSGGWNAYDVWRRLIKDARDRRAATQGAEAG